MEHAFGTVPHTPPNAASSWARVNDGKSERMGIWSKGWPAMWNRWTGLGYTLEVGSAGLTDAICLVKYLAY